MLQAWIKSRPGVNSTNSLTDTTIPSKPLNHSQNGPRSKALSFVSSSQESPIKNAFIERFNKSFREEVLNANLFNTMSEAQEAAEVWLTDYNEYRPHESLGDVPPAMFKPRMFQPEISTFNL